MCARRPTSTATRFVPASKSFKKKLTKLFACILMDIWIWILPLRGDAPIWLQSAAHWGQTAQMHICRKQTVSFDLLPYYKVCPHCGNFICRVQKAEVLWSHKEVDVFCFIAIHTVQKTIYTLYIYINRYIKYCCTSDQKLWTHVQLSLSLIKYWIRTQGRNCEEEGKKLWI